jgi:hypothetical protein
MWSRRRLSQAKPVSGRFSDLPQAKTDEDQPKAGKRRIAGADHPWSRFSVSEHSAANSETAIR